jgi:hypothetical protein
MNADNIITPQTRSGNPQNNVRLLRIIAFCMLGVSCILIVLGVYFYQQEDKFLNSCKLIKCRITSIEEKRVGKAYVTFTEVNGNYKPFTLFFEYDASDSELGYNENDVVEVYYYEKDLSKSEIKDSFNNHITSFILLIIGFTFMLDFPILFLVTGKIKKRQQQKQQFGIKDSVISE